MPKTSELISWLWIAFAPWIAVFIANKAIKKIRKMRPPTNPYVPNIYFTFNHITKEVKECTPEEWVIWHREVMDDYNNRVTVARHVFGNRMRVVTRFISINRSYTKQLLFETEIWDWQPGGPRSVGIHCTYEDAIIEHHRIVNRLQIALIMDAITSHKDKHPQK